MTDLMVYDPVYDVLRPTDIFNDDLFAPIEGALLTTKPLSGASSAWPSFGNLPLDMYETDNALVVVRQCHIKQMFDGIYKQIELQ